MYTPTLQNHVCHCSRSTREEKGDVTLRCEYYRDEVGADARRVENVGDGRRKEEAKDPS